MERQMEEEVRESCPKRQKLDENAVCSGVRHEQNVSDSTKEIGVASKDSETKDDQPMEVGYSEASDNFATTKEEIQRLKQFDVLDEVKESNDEEENRPDCGEEDSVSGESVSDLPEDELDALLDANLPDSCKQKPTKERPYEIRRKIVLEEKGINHFEVLPSGWLAIIHNSGMPIYLHKQSRVCTMSKPYLLGPSSARRHNIPVSAIPCLNYRRALEEEVEFQKKETDRLNAILKSGNFNVTLPVIQPFSTPNTSFPNQETSTSKVYNEINMTKEKGSCTELSNPTENKETDGSDKNASHNKDCNDTVYIPSDVTSCEVNDVNNIIEHEIKKCNATNISIALNGTDKNDKLFEHKIRNNDSSADKKLVSINIAIHGERNVENIENVEGANNEPDKASTDDANGERSKQSSTNTNTAQSIGENGEPASEVVGRPLILPGGIMMPTAKIETAQENWKKSHLTHEEVNDYCKKLFQFKINNTMKFTSWLQKRKFAKMRKMIQRPTLPNGTKLISFPVRNAIINTAQGGTPQVVLGAAYGRQRRSEWIMNPNGRSFVCIFHEYVQRVLKEQPSYVYEELENATTPYRATVSINGVQYGVGQGTSKRQAKSAAAKASLEILIPEMKDKITQDGKLKGQACRPDEEDFAFFNHVAIEDPRIAEFCEKTMEPSPHAILETCLLRNFGSGDREIKCEVKAYKHKRISFTMTVGKHTTTVICKNKKDGKQRASQGILQALHPHITSWGSLLRLYGSRTVKNFKEKKQEEQEITLLQNKAAVNQPNFAILEKLAREMEIVNRAEGNQKPIGSISVSVDLPTHSGSNLKNVNL